MPSSTSSSRAPDLNWGAIWLLTVLVVLVAGGAWELTLRANGFRPHVPDDPAVWALQRQRALGNRPVVLLGASRMHLGVDPAVLSEVLNRPVIQLAIDGANPMPVFSDLADDETFRGDIWISLRLDYVFGALAGGSREYLDYYRESGGNLNSRWNTAAGIAFDGRLALRSAITSVRALMAPSLPVPSYIAMRGDRFKAADYTLLEREARLEYRISRTRILYSHWVDHPPTIDVFDDSLAVLERRVQAIVRRGGEVTLLRFPTGPQIWTISDSVFPREIYWDRPAARSSATVLHYRDEPTLSSFDLPDESHLDYRDVPAFTRALAEAVAAR